jgi:hypothetical protein
MQVQAYVVISRLRFVCVAHDRQLLGDEPLQVRHVASQLGHED